MRVTLPVAALLVLAVPAAAHQGKAQAAEATPLLRSALAPAATVDAFHKALQQGDARAAAALLSDDALIFESGGAERSKAEYQAAHLPADIEFTQAVKETITSRSGSASGSTAWVASEGRVTGTFHGRPVDRATTETMVLRQTPRGWRITHVHWSSAPAH